MPETAAHEERILALAARKQPVAVAISYRDGEWSGRLDWTESPATFTEGAIKPTSAHFNAEGLETMLEGLLAEAERLAAANDAA